MTLNEWRCQSLETLNLELGIVFLRIEEMRLSCSLGSSSTAPKSDGTMEALASLQACCSSLRLVSGRLALMIELWDGPLGRPESYLRTHSAASSEVSSETTSTGGRRVGSVKNADDY
jgi:hypothetical protein